MMETLTLNGLIKFMQLFKKVLSRPARATTRGRALQISQNIQEKHWGPALLFFF